MYDLVEAGLNGFLGHLAVLLDRFALGGDASKLGTKDAEATFGFRLQHDLLLALDDRALKLARP